MGGRRAKTYGKLTRRVREEKGFGLRQFAKMIGVSATYLSQIERGELPPPAEERVATTAALLELHPDELLALAGRVAADLEEIIREKPKQTAVLLRRVKAMSPDELDRMIEGLQTRKRS